MAQTTAINNDKENVKTSLTEQDRINQGEFIAKMHYRSALGSEQHRLAQAIGVTNESILKDLDEMGYDRETVTLLYLVPLIYVAWAEGTVSHKERTLILETARMHGYEESSKAYLKLQQWLDERPSDEFFERTLHVIGSMMHSLSVKQREASKHDIISYCIKVAEASSGIAGFIKDQQMISDEEKIALEHIAEALSIERERGFIELAQFSEMIGITDQRLLRELLDLGYTSETIKVLELVPMIQVAWAEGEVTARERNLIMEASRYHAISYDSPAYRKLNELIKVRPSEDFFNRSLTCLRALLRLRRPETRVLDETYIVLHCIEVAKASATPIGTDPVILSGSWSRICDKELEELQKVIDGLKSNYVKPTPSLGHAA